MILEKIGMDDQDQKLNEPQILFIPLWTLKKVDI